MTRITLMIDFDFGGFGMRLIRVLADIHDSGAIKIMSIQIPSLSTDCMLHQFTWGALDKIKDVIREKHKVPAHWDNGPDTGGVA